MRIITIEIQNRVLVGDGVEGVIMYANAALLDLYCKADNFKGSFHVNELWCFRCDHQGLHLPVITNLRDGLCSANLPSCSVDIKNIS